MWCACTPQLRYYEYQHSRGSEVVTAILGARFEGVLGSDFYASYNIYEGLHQRCWVHLLRDRHELKEKYPEDADVQQWAKEVKAVYERAVAYAGPDPSLPAAKQEAARRTQQHIFEQELWQLCTPYAHTASLLHTLCERVERFLPELFVFVAVSGVPAENNLAERSVRPLVIARKISGARAVLWAVRPAWVSSASLAPGPLKDSIRSCNASLFSPKSSLYHNCEQYPSREDTVLINPSLLY